MRRVIDDVVGAETSSKRWEYGRLLYHLPILLPKLVCYLPPNSFTVARSARPILTERTMWFLSLP